MIDIDLNVLSFKLFMGFFLLYFEKNKKVVYWMLSYKKEIDN